MAYLFFPGKDLKEQIILNGMSRIDKIEQVLDHNSAKFQTFVNLMRTRIDAVESVLSSPLQILRILFFSIFNPSKVATVFDDAHKRVIEEIKKRSRSEKIVRLSIFVIVAALTSCVSPSTHKKKLQEAYDNGFVDADKECIHIQERAQAYIESLKSKIANSNRGLPYNPCVENPDSIDCDNEPYDGEAGWLK